NSRVREFKDPRGRSSMKSQRVGSPTPTLRLVVQIIAWPNFGEPGKARKVEPSRLVKAQLVLDGEPFFDRPTLKSMVERQVTTLGMQPIALAIGVIVAGYVECAQRVADGDMRGAFNTLFTMEAAED